MKVVRFMRFFLLMRLGLDNPVRQRDPMALAELATDPRIPMNRYLPKLAFLLAGLSGSALAGSEADAFNDSFSKTEKSFVDRFTFGSYGELHGRVGDGDDNIDMHRLVGLMNFQATERLRFVSELEFEHVFYHDEAGGDEDMEIEIEQAYLEYALQDDLLLTAGIQLVPVGIINLTHEPTTFFGVERPNVERYIVPTTWWEGAVGVVKTYENGLQLDFMAHTAMDMGSDGYIRSGRPKLDLNQYTEDQSWGVTGRAKYTGISGLELATTLQYQHDVSSTVGGDQNTMLAEGHAIYRKGGFQFRALTAYWNVDGFSDSDTEDQWGYYLEPSYTFDIPFGKAGVFARFSQYEYFNGTRRDNDEISVGANYWPIDEVVLKVDYTWIDTNDVDNQTVNFGLGYYF
jgi:hypothetical protein